MNRSTEHRWDSLLEELARAQEDALSASSAARRARARERFVATSTEAAPRSNATWGWWATAAALVLFVAWALSFSAPEALTFEVDGAEPSPGRGGLVVAPVLRPAEVSFSDGSRASVGVGAELKVHELRTRGADLLLSKGRVDVDIRHLPRAAWTVQAGPYRVDVVGTAFSVDWEPDGGRLSVEMKRGHVRVSGPGIDGVRDLVGEETMRISETSTPPGPPSEPTVVARVEPPTRAEPAVEAPEPDTSVLPPREPKRPARTESTRRRAPAPEPEPEPQPEPAPTRDWRDLAKTGDFAAALQRAQTLGFTKLCRQLDAAPLLELADVARYARDERRAIEALEAIRRRFPGHELASTAAFDLGRLPGRGCAHAQRWLQTYLDERPHGRMASEARSRLAECDRSRQDHR